MQNEPTGSRQHLRLVGSDETPTDPRSIERLERDSMMRLSEVLMEFSHALPFGSGFRRELEEWSTDWRLAAQLRGAAI